MKDPLKGEIVLMPENNNSEHEISKKALPGGLIYKIVSVVALVVILVVVFFVGTVHTDKNISAENETEDESLRVAVSQASSLDGGVDDESTTAFVQCYSGYYLSGVLTNSVSVGTTLDSYIELKTEKTESSSSKESEDESDSDAEDEVEESVEETETETDEAESSEDTAEYAAAVESEEAEEEYDPRESVWDHYPNLGVISAPNYLHIRTEPSLDGEIIGILFNMSGVNLLDVSEDGEWYHIVSNGIEGYINAEFVITGDEAKQLAYENAFPAVTVNAEVLNVREEPNTDSTILTQIIAGSLYEVIEETNDEWLKIVIGSDIEGYVAREFVTYDYALEDAVAYSETTEEEEETINPVRLELVNNAMQYLGGTYVWGGTTLGVGVDCSGFVLRLFEQYGYNLPRTSYWQVNCGTEVAFEDMQPGDLIFYWNNSLGRIGHVAIYIGNNLIIHAASELRGIVIDDYRFMTPYCARNIIGE